jgi:hypothetical protein
MTAREMWVSEIEGSDEMKAPAFTARLADEGVASVELHEKLHTPESWTDLSAEIARALAIVCGPCIKPEAKR